MFCASAVMPNCWFRQRILDLLFTILAISSLSAAMQLGLKLASLQLRWFCLYQVASVIALRLVSLKFWLRILNFMIFSCFHWKKKVFWLCLFICLSFCKIMEIVTNGIWWIYFLEFLDLDHNVDAGIFTGFQFFMYDCDFYAFFG